jgi:flagellar hook-associated protein 2
MFTVNGIASTSQSNTADKVVDGVTIILKGVTETDDNGDPTPVNLSVTRDTTTAATAVQTFVDAYNSLNKTISTLTAFDVDKETQSALTGDATTRNIQNTMASALRVFVSSNSAIQSLADIGISTNYKDGTLDLDMDKLNNALSGNLTDVTKLFTGDNGLAGQVSSATDGILGGNGKTGSLEISQESIQDTIDDLQDQYNSMQDRINATINTYRQQFVQLDSMVAQMNSMSDYLTQQFSAMSASSKK